LDKWTECLENGGQIDVIYTDFEKAFDKVPHRRLISKMYSYGINKDIIGWVEAFLTGRRQRIRINGKLSRWRNISSGIPQGSILGPILFIIYINGLVEKCVEGSEIYLYADDAKLFRYIESEEHCKKLQEDLNNVKNWSDEWMLKLNIAKCKVMSYGRQLNYDFPYYVHEKEINYALQKVNTINDLGVIFDSQLKFDEHIYVKINKAYSMLGIIKRNFRNISDSSFVLLYKSLVRSHLEYANAVWSPYRQKYIEKVEKVQKRATKLLSSNKGLTYEDRLKKLNLPTLVYRRHRGDMIETFKIIHGIYNVDSTLQLLLSHNALTRGHRFKLFQSHVHYDSRKYFFVNRIISLWNNLPDYVVTADTVNSFKNRLDKHWVAQECKFNWKAIMPEAG
jgi:hypothetical protein